MIYVASALCMIYVASALCMIDIASVLCMVYVSLTNIINVGIWKLRRYQGTLVHQSLHHHSASLTL